MSSYESWWEEKRSAYLYQIMAENEKNVLHKKLFENLHSAAEKQAQIWEEKLKTETSAQPSFHPDLRTRLVALLVKYLGTDNVHRMLSAMKIRGMSVFLRYHSEHKHTSLNSISNLRAAVFGINDGLVSNASLILGVAGANANSQFVVIAGVAGLLAGACSMAAGEYISVRSQREVFEYQIEIEKQELAEYPEEEMQELSLIYQARGIPTESAEQIAKLMIDNPTIGLDTLAREELGLNPDDLVSPIGATVSSFLSFSIGAVIPLLPFFFTKQSWALTASIGLTAFALFLIGLLISLLTNQNPLKSGFRMLFVGCIAGGITFVIGHLLGVAMH